MIRGSSPQVRGTSSAAQSPGAGSRAHPRRCGEHPLPAHHRQACPGSSPQVRGTSHHGGGVWVRHGLIPAGAGNIIDAQANAGKVRAHPRRCGEHTVRCPKSISPRGSSPQVRGTLLILEAGHQDLRLIPAGAGNMRAVAGAAPVVWAHPRRCGEHRPEPLPGAPEPGSSPQVRGTFLPATGHSTR